MKIKLVFLFFIILFLNNMIVKARNDTNNRTDNQNTQYTKDTLNWNIKTLDTALDSSFMSEMEKNVILEMNMLRSNPKKYAKLYIQPRLQRFRGNYYDDSIHITLVTTEGKQAVVECINALNIQNPLPTIAPNYDLYKMAEYMTIQQSKTHETGHNTPNGKTFVDRLRLFKIQFQSCGENISYGYNNARDIIVQLLIDDGVKNRGHRLNLFKPFNKVGISIGTHQKYNYMCVQDFGL